MTQAPHVIRGARVGFRLGEGKLEDTLMVALLDTHCGLYMAQTSDNLARKYDISREQQDEYALRSQQCAGEAARVSLSAPRGYLPRYDSGCARLQTRGPGWSR